MTPVTTAIDFFTEEELKCNGSGIIKLDPRFAEELPELRREWGALCKSVNWNPALNLNSCCRSPEYNKAIGGHPRSLHLTDNPVWPTFGTMGCDIRWRSWDEDKKRLFAEVALKRGWRVGLHDGFCHIDRGHDVGIGKKIFVYGSYSGNLAKELQA